MQSQVAWICIDNTRLQSVDDKASTLDKSALCQAWDNICATRQPVVADLDELAQRFGILKGKWLVFAQPAEVDSLWSRIARATHAGTLGISAKVSPHEGDGSDRHVICIFTQDYTDESEVGKVRNALRRLGVRWKIGYKPDIYTDCRVYSGNSWHIPPTRYRD